MSQPRSLQIMGIERLVADKCVRPVPPGAHHRGRNIPPARPHRDPHGVFSKHLRILAKISAYQLDFGRDEAKVPASFQFKTRSSGRSFGGPEGPIGARFTGEYDT